MTDDEKKDQLSLDLTEDAENRIETDIEHSTSDIDIDGEILEWTCHPAKYNRTKTIIVTLFIVAIVVAIYLWTYSALFTILAVLILTGSLSPYYFPTRYKLSESEIRIKTTTQNLVKKWTQFRSCYPDKNGVLLSPFVRPSRLENFRGVYIRFADNKDEVVGFVMRKVNQVRAEELGEEN